jgi:hypothetical protein
LYYNTDIRYPWYRISLILNIPHIIRFKCFEIQSSKYYWYF